MRRGRRGFSGGAEFSSSGEDSFVAVVVTKLTGALLFILLLTMMIMALLPKGQDGPPVADTNEPRPPLAVATPGQLPDAVVGRPYRLALAATNIQGEARWTVIGELPEGLSFDEASGQIVGVPIRATAQPVELALAVHDELARSSSAASLTVLEVSAAGTGFAARWRPAWTRVPTREWAEHGFGFLLIALVYMVGLNSLSAIDRKRRDRDDDSRTAIAWRARLTLYRAVVSVAAVAAVAGLGYWLVRGPNL